MAIGRVVVAIPAFMVRVDIYEGCPGARYRLSFVLHLFFCHSRILFSIIPNIALSVSGWRLSPQM